MRTEQDYKNLFFEIHSVLIPHHSVLSHSVQASYQVSVHHQMNEVVEYAESEGHAVLREKLALKENGKGQCLLPAHEEDALEPAPRDVKQTD
jgi:hypothetical protein